MKFDTKALLRLRRRFGWRQEDAARACGISSNAYNRAETGGSVRQTTADAILERFREEAKREAERPSKDIDALEKDQDIVTVPVIRDDDVPF